MIAQAIAFVLDALFNLFILAALVRFWMQVFKAPVRNPLAQFTMALTDFAVKPLRRLIPGLFKVDLASLVVAWLLEFVLQVLLALLKGADFTQAPGALSIVLLMSFVMLIRLSVYVFMGALIVGAVLSWVSPYHPVAPFFAAFSNPFLKPFRRAIPLIGGVDITPVLVLIAFQLILMLPVTLLESEVARMLTRALL